MAEAGAVTRLEALEEWAPVGRERGLWSDAFSRLIRNRLAMVALIVLTVVAAVAILGNTTDVVRRYDPRVQDYDVLQASPSTAHFFGTDNLGRDNWARVLQGLLISLEVGFGVQIFVLAIGMPIAVVGGAGGTLE